MSSSSLQPGQQIAQTLELPLGENPAHVRPSEIDYLRYMPKGASPDGEYPLLLFLHGAGQRGTDVQQVRDHGPPSFVEQQADFPFITVSPQCRPDCWWTMDGYLTALEHLINHLRETLPVDPTRIYLTGLSLGGYGTFALAARNPGLFAAAVPICGGGDPEWAEKLKSTPLWAFHGERDPVVPLIRSTEMVEAITAAGGQIQLTIYPDAEHDSWTRTYESPAVYEWLLTHQLQQGTT
ncbi:MAG: prolyl oligopeptidase family serine peptidase [Pirellulaceae bacterium]